MLYQSKIPFGSIAKAQCITGKKMTLKEVEAIAKGASIIVNTAIFEFDTGEIRSSVVADGVKKGQSVTWGIAFPSGGSPTWTWDNGIKAPNYVGAYSYAVTEGQVKDGLKDKAARGRTAIGLTASGELVIYLVTDNDTTRCSTATLCNRLVNMGCVNAINLDGGGSSQGVTPIGRYDSGRPCPAWLAIWLTSDAPQKEDKTMKICIDAGHGVETAGKCSPDGTYFEHEFNLDVAKRVKAHLERCRVDVVMTREDEHDISLAQRCTICNDAGCSYFFSVHTNAAGNGGWYDAEGWSAHIISKGGKAEQLAEKIRKQAIPLLACKDRGVNVNNYQVLRDTNCSAVLIEHGFHTSKTEVEKLKSADYRAKCAEADAKGICDQIGVSWVPEKPVIPDHPRPWYYDAQQWVIEQGISDGTKPDSAATRAEVWTMLKSMAKK